MYNSSYARGKQFSKMARTRFESLSKVVLRIPWLAEDEKVTVFEA
jgi:hypothetical protein